MKRLLTRVGLVTFSVVTVILAYWPGVSYAAPNAYVTYFDQDDTTVKAKVYFRDSVGDYTKVQWAKDMTDEGSELLWLGQGGVAGANLDIYDEGAPLKSVELTLNKYMNYYVRIAKVDLSDITLVRLFPADIGSNYGSDRQDGGYAHGNFENQSYMCANCHVTHSALKSQLLKTSSYYELCMLCHSNANTQSKYDVESGMVTVGGPTLVPSLAGPFVTGAVSAHNADDTGGVIPVNVPGSDPGKKLGLTCVSCHQGHAGNDDNYRFLKKTVFADDGKTIVANNIDVEAYAVTANATSGEAVSMVKGNVEFCTACHLDYDKGNAWNPGGSYAPNVVPGPGTARYRHPVSVGNLVYSVYGSDGLRDPAYIPRIGDDLPLQYYSGEQKAGLTDKRTTVVCSTCHFAHGSSRTFMVEETVYENKYMLRLNNYGVCQSCHKK